MNPHRVNATTTMALRASLCLFRVIHSDDVKLRLMNTLAMMKKHRSQAYCLIARASSISALS